MKNVVLSLSLFSVIFSSCSNEMESISSSNLEAEVRVQNLFGESVETKNGTLCFTDEVSFNQVLKNLEDAQKKSAKALRAFSIEDPSIQVEGFTSMYDMYDEAMEEAPRYYDTKDNYEVYKAKYSTLYFPEVGKDYAAYMPISNKNLAKIANKDGFIMVNDQYVDCKDIKNYDDLMKLGLNLPNDKLRSSKEVFSHQQGDNKLWINASVQVIRTTPPLCLKEFHFEVAFRDKGFLGIWYNRKASTTLHWNLVTGSFSATDSRSINDSFSSHDYYPEQKNVPEVPTICNLGVYFGPWGGTLFSVPSFTL